MSRGFYQGVASMATYGRQVDNIAHNLANLNTTGYKGVTTSLRSFRVPGEEDSGERLEVVARRDWTQGSLLRTDNPFDLALRGEGFFEVEGPEGPSYTRNGAFKIDASGVLQTQEGYPLAWEGANGVIDPAGERVVVDGTGLVRQGPIEVGKLRLADFEAKDRLWVDSEGYFRRPPEVGFKTFTARVHQGSIETSNAAGFDSMVELIQLQRSFQSMTRLLSNLQDGYERLSQMR